MALGILGAGAIAQTGEGETGATGVSSTESVPVPPVVTPPPEDMPLAEFIQKRVHLKNRVVAILKNKCRRYGHVHFRFTHTEIRPTRRQENLNYWQRRVTKAQRKDNMCWEAIRYREYRQIPLSRIGSWNRIHRCEGSWSDSGDPYWGGLQMDRGFMGTYGRDALRHYGGFANIWPAWVQIMVADRAYRGYAGYGPRGFSPWPYCQRYA